MLAGKGTDKGKFSVQAGYNHISGNGAVATMKGTEIMAIIGSFCGTLLALGVAAFVGWLGDEFSNLEANQRQYRADYNKRRR